MRDRVASDLVQKYECVVLSRNAGMTIKTERDLGNVSAATGGGKELPSLPAADYAISGSTFQGNGSNTDMAFICENLKSKSQSLVRETFHQVDNPESADKAVEASARILKLKPRKASQEASGQLDERWAVLPFARLEDRKSVLASSPDADLAADAIMALQDSKALKGVVDRDEISKLIAELKIESLSSSNEGSAAKIANLLGADKIITGVVSPCKGRLRLDLLLIDAKTAVLVDAATAMCQKNALSKAAGDLSLQLAKRKRTPVSLTPSTPELRSKEAANYKGILERFASYDDDYPETNPQAISAFESAYMLIGDNANAVCELLKTLSKFSRESAASFTPYQKRQIKNLTLVICEPLSEELKRKNQVYETLARVLYAAGDYEDALGNLNSLEKLCPDADKEWINYLRGDIYMELNDPLKAVACYLKADEPKKLAEAYHKLGDKDAEYAALKKIEYYDESFMASPLPARFIDMKREREGAAAAARFINVDNFHSYVLAKPEMQLKTALLLAEAGEKLHAQQKLYYLLSFSRDSFTKEEQATLQKKLDDLTAELGPDACKMKTFKSICNLPNSYKIYIQPMGSPDLTAINEAAALIKDFTGLEAVVRPALPLPTNYAYDKARGQYDAIKLFYAARHSINYPSDGLMLAIAIRDDLFNSDADNLRYIYSYSNRKFGAVIMSTSALRNSYAKKIALIECDALAGIMTNKKLECINTPCVYRSDGSTEGISKKQFLICYECEQKLKSLDLEKANRIFRNPDMSGCQDDLKALDDYKRSLK